MLPADCIQMTLHLLGWLCVQEARALVGWAAAILRQLDVEATKKAVVKLLECQVQCGDGAGLGLLVMRSANL